MIISTIINDSFGLLSKQLKFYCWHFKRNLNQNQRQELVDLFHEQHFERLANKIRALNQTKIADCKQQVSLLLFKQCLEKNRRHQLKQLIESQLLDVDVRLDNYGQTLLHKSAYNLDVELVKLLIDEGANIRLRDCAGNTALHVAIQSYRNGAVLDGNELDIVQNLTLIVKLLLEADRNQLNERYKRKRKRPIGNQEEKSTLAPATRDQDIKMNDDDESSLSHELNSMSSRSYPDSPVPRKTRGGSALPATKESKTCTGPKGPQEMPTREQPNAPIDQLAMPLNPILMEDSSSSLVDTKNCFGRTALHCCVSTVGEKHLSHFVQLLISYGADTDATDRRMRTPLYFLVKRSGVSAIRQKCQAITHLLQSGCDDLGLSIDPQSYFTSEAIENLEKNISDLLQAEAEAIKSRLKAGKDGPEPIFEHNTFRRVPSLKHLARLHLIWQQDETRLQRQKRLSLPKIAPASLNLYMNRKILDQSELF